MKHIGIRQLRENMARWLRRTFRSRPFKSTFEARPITSSVPAQDQHIPARLEANGALRRGKGDPLAIKPLPQDPGKRTLSQTLAEQRADER